jgi:nicotinamide-nucleotide amidase
MNAEIVSVGTELLLGDIVDTNAAYLGRLFAECGIGHIHRQTVGDNLARLTEALRVALDRAEVVVTVGGLGPTEDDLTREGIAAALSDPLVLDLELERSIRSRFEARGLPWRAAQSRQAMRPSCAEPIDNPNGTAPGLVCRKGGRVVVALPGPPSEFVPMADGPLRALLAELGGGQVIRSRTLRVCGMGESAVAEALGSLLAGDNPTVAPYAKRAEVHLRVTARAEGAAQADDLIRPIASLVRERLGDAVYGEDEVTLEEAVVGLLRERGKTVATAESLTAGMLASRLAGVAGASHALAGGVVAYTLAAKIRELGLDPALLQARGAVSAACAEAMARGARERWMVDFAVALTGEAGPVPSEAEVGLVYVAVASPAGTKVEEARFRGSREDIRWRATQLGLVTLRRALLSG